MIIGSRVTNPGEMRTSVTLKNRSVTTDSGGARVPTYSTIATVWAKWANVHGSEVWAAESVNAIAPATVMIRYRSGIDHTCVVVKGSDIYEIVSIDNIQERNEYLELKVQKAKAG
jgi:SPP1 family predicted phage head-tail adaptor